MGWILRGRRPWRRKGRVLLLLGLSACAVWTTSTTGGRATIVPASHPVQPPPSQQIRIQTLNVFGLPWPLAPDVEPRCQRIARQIASENADVVALQEAWGEDASAPFAMPYHHRASCRQPACLYGSSGLMTLSRHPIRRAETRFFDAGEGIETIVSKGILRTTVALPDGELDVWNLHLQSGLDDAAIRAAQIAQLLRWLERDANVHRAAVAGDFNCAPGDPEFATLRAGMQRLGFVHASCGKPTYDATVNPLAMPERPKEIDHIFVRGHGTALAAARCFDQPIDGQLPSDHFGVEAVLGTAATPAYSSRR